MLRPPSQRVTTVALIAIAVAALALRWAALGRESLWFDEGMTWWLASLAPGRLLEVVRGDVAVPAYFLLLRGWTLAFGDSPAGMRGMSALAATVALVPFYVVARHALRSNGAALAACGLMAISYMQLQHAREARYYALLSLLAAAALACVPAMANRRARGHGAAFVAFATVGLYTHNMMLFCLAGLNAAWLCWPGARPARARVVDLFVANAMVGLLYLPWVPTLLAQMRWMTGSFWAERPGAFDLANVTSALAGVDVYALPGYAWLAFDVRWRAGGVAAAVALATVALGALAVGTRDRDARRKAVALAAFALGPVLLVFAYSRVGQPIFIDRVLIAGSAALPVLFAMPLDRARAAGVRLAAGLLVGVVFVGGALSTHALLTETRKEDWRGAYAVVAALPPSDRRLLVFVANEGELPFAHYAAADPSRAPEPRTGAPAGFFDLDPPRTIRRVTSDADLAPLRAAVASGRWDEVVLVLSHDAFSDPHGLTERELRAHWNVVGETNLLRVRVLRFARR